MRRKQGTEMKKFQKPKVILRKFCKLRKNSRLLVIFSPRLKFAKNF